MTWRITWGERNQSVEQVMLVCFSASALNIHQAALAGICV
jgi:hypothetical protein